MVPILDEIIAAAGDAAGKHVLTALSHRCRLHVPSHGKQKPYAHVLAESKDSICAADGPSQLCVTGRTQSDRRAPGSRRPLFGGSRRFEPRDSM